MEFRVHNIVSNLHIVLNMPKPVISYRFIPVFLAYDSTVGFNHICNVPDSPMLTPPLDKFIPFVIIHSTSL